MRIMFCGDKHLKINKFELAKSFLRWMESTLEEHKPDLYVCLGDDMDQHAVIRSELLSEMRTHFDNVLKLNIPIVYVVGNHDHFSASSSKYHAFQSMKGLHKDLHIVDEITELYGMTFVPYLHDISRFPNTGTEICVAHQTFLGADYGTLLADTGVRAKDFNYEVIISGHVHLRQRVDNVIYPGSPYSQSASDLDQVKGVMLFDSASYEEKFIQSPMPMWRSIKLNLANVSVEESVALIEQNTLQYPNDNWVVSISGPKGEIGSIIDNKIVTDIKKKTDIKFKVDITDKQKVVHSIKAVSIEDILAEYVNKIYTGSTDKSLILKSIRDVLIEADTTS